MQLATSVGVFEVEDKVKARDMALAEDYSTDLNAIVHDTKLSHVNATSSHYAIWISRFSAMVYGVETCYLNAVDHDVGPRVQNANETSKDINMNTF